MNKTNNEEEPTWQCVGYNPTSWSLGICRNGQMYNITAHVNRREEDGAWSWMVWSSRVIGVGIEPSRIEATKEAEKCLKGREGLFFPDIWSEKVPEKNGPI